MPQMGFGMSEGTVARWLKEEGAHVEDGEPVAEIETDKAVVEFESYASGILHHIVVPEGVSVRVGQTIAVVGEADEDVRKPDFEAPTPEPRMAAPPPPPISPPAEPEYEGPAPRSDEVRASPVARRLAEEMGIDLSTITGTGPLGRIIREDVLAAGPQAEAEEDETPAPESTVVESHVDDEPAPAAIEPELPADEAPVPAAIELGPPTDEAPAPAAIEPEPQAEEAPAPAAIELGPPRNESLAPVAIEPEPEAEEVPAPAVIEPDTVADEPPAPAAIEPELPAAEPPVTAAIEPALPADEAPAPAVAETQPTTAGDASDDIIPLSRMRQQIARVTVRSKAEKPHFYLTCDIDMTRAMELRRQLNDALEAQGERITVNDLVIKACAKALEEHPKFNAVFHGHGIRMNERVNIGVAVAEEESLIIPAIMDCAGKSLRELALASRDLSDRARSGTLRPDEYSGGTFAISNLGMFDVTSFAAIIQPPQSAVLAVGSVTRRPTVFGDDLGIADMMTATLSADHRIVDGVEGARFMMEIKRLLESPLALLDVDLS